MNNTRKLKKKTNEPRVEREREREKRTKTIEQANNKETVNWAKGYARVTE